MAITIKKGITPNIDTGDTGIASSTPDSIAPGTHIGTYHLAANPNFFEPSRTNNFEFVVTDIDNIIRAGMDGTESSAVQKIKNAQEIISLSVVSTSVPHFTQSTIEIKRGNSTLKYAGTPSFSAGTLRVNDYIGADTKAALMAWQSLSYNVYTEKVGLASQYKKDCWLVEYAPDGQVVRQWRMHGCWISALSEDDFNAEQNDKRQITVTIEYDRAELDVSGITE